MLLKWEVCNVGEFYLAFYDLSYDCFGRMGHSQRLEQQKSSRTPYRE